MKKNYYPKAIQRGNKNNITPSFPLKVKGMKGGYWIGLVISLFIMIFALTVVNNAQAAIGTDNATCTNQSRTTGTSLTCTVATENLDANNIAILWFAGDNTATSDGNDGLLSSVTDSAGNTWTVERCFTNAQGGAGNGATTCLAWSKLTNALTSGSGTITANFASLDAKAMVVREFTVAASSTLSVIGTPQDLANDGADPGSMTISGLTSSDYLFVRSTALERKSSTWSVTSLYTTSGCNATAGSGGDAGNIETCGEFRIYPDPCTGDTSNPSATNKDNASIFLAFKEVPAPSSPNKLGFYVQPSDTTAGATMTPAVQVEIQDLSGNRVTSASDTITLAIGSNPGGGALSGTILNVPTSNGVATFSDLSIDKWANGYTLTATSITLGLTMATSNSFNIRGPYQLAFLQQPSATGINATISPAVTVEVQDSLGNRVLADNSTSVSIQINTGTGTLSGTTPKTAVNGVATFDNLAINQIGTFTLKATATGLTETLPSDPFNIIASTFGSTQCMADRWSQTLDDLVCTAGDVRITKMEVAPSMSGTTSCVGGETVILDLTAYLSFTGGATKNDIGVYIANDGKGLAVRSVSGGSASCTVKALPKTFPFSDADGDTCGDNGSGDDNPLSVEGVPVLCQSSSDSPGKLYIPFSTSWDHQSTRTCSADADVVPSLKTKCNIPATALGTINVLVIPKITKTDNKTSLAAGESTTYTVVISNNTGVTLSGALFKDDLPSNLTVGSVTCAVTSGAATCPGSFATMETTGVPIPDMPNNSSLTITIPANVNSNSATFSNTATVSVLSCSDGTGNCSVKYIGDTCSDLSGTCSLSCSDSTGSCVGIDGGQSCSDGSGVCGPYATAVDSNGGSGSGSGGSRVKVIKWREVFR